ncbi:MAG: hypothetical protein VR69_06695 [Peptococcaceae bacterium BRH_c4b]|nr:MAG: hypothetical protein VR69_06695 [Peptococcaceae bacterium BRH_c4b]
MFNIYTSGVTTTQLSELLNKATSILKLKAISTPRLDAEVLLAHCLGMDRAGLYARSHMEPEAATLEKYLSLVERRGHGEPVAYLTGVREFMGLEFNVTPAVLIPRPETELLVETALGIIENATRGRFPVSHIPTGISQPVIVDVGTGSGAIAVSLASRLPGAKIYAVDISPEALAVARINAERHGVTDRMDLFCGDLLAPLPGKLTGGVDLIAANLPYIPSGDMDGLMPDVARFEPHTALDGGEDGLQFYRRLIPLAENFLRPGGALLMEIAPGQAVKLANMVRQGDGSLCRTCLKCDTEPSPCRTWQTEIYYDFAGRERLVVALLI